MKSLIAAAMLAAPLAMMASAPSAQAKAHIGFHFYFGDPHYNYRPGLGYFFRPGYGWYQPRYHMYHGWNGRKMSCSQAARFVERRGYDVVARRDCAGSVYSFRAVHRGHRVNVFINARTGNIWRR